MVLFKGGGHRVSPRVHLVFDAREQRGSTELPLEMHVPFEGLQLGSSNAKKWDHHQRKKFFKNNSVEALILLKEEHQGLY